MSANKKIYALSAAYFIFLLFILFIFGYTPANDTDSYIEYARVCIDYGEPYPCIALIKGYPFIWNIGSINLIVLSLWLFDSIYPLLPFMCLLKALSALLIAKITQRLINDDVAIITLIIFILYPNNWGQSTTLLSEIPSIFFALFSLCLLLRGSRLIAYIIAGVMLFLSNYFRSVAIIFIVSVAIYYALFCREALLRRIVPCLGGYVICIIIVGSESYLRTGYFIYKGDSLWFNICDDAYDNAIVGPHWDQETYEKGKPRYIENMSELDCFQCSEIWKSRCLPWIMSHKMEWIKKVPYRIGYMYFNDIDNMSFCLEDKSAAENNFITLPYRHILSEYSSLSQAQWASIICTLYYWLMMVMFVIGTIIMAKEKQWQSLTLPLLIIVIGTLALTLVLHGETRFKAPFMPFIMMIAACPMVFIKRHP